jgi:hypothetical protein
MSLLSQTFKSSDILELLQGDYQITQSIPQLISPQTSEDKKIKLIKGYKISVLFQKGDTIYYQYLLFDTLSVNYKKYNFKNGNVIREVFQMSKSDFKQMTNPIYRQYKGVTAGAYTVPFRLRDIGGESFDFESSLSLQANLVFGFGTKKSDLSWFDLSFGIGVTSIGLTSKNSKVEEDRTASAFTLSLGTVFKPAPYANIGLFLGTDFLGNKDKEIQWVHDGKLWFGLGINISFNQIKTNKLSNEEKQD